MIERPLRILLTDPHLKGGGQVRYVATLARELTRRGHTVAIGCKSGSVLVARAKETGCDVRDDLVLRGGLRPRAWVHDVRKILEVLRTCPPDVLHVNGSQDHWVCALANRAEARPVCLVRTRHNTYPVPNTPANRLLNRAWTDYQIVVCESVRQALASQSLVDDSRLCSIHNGVDVDDFVPNPDLRSLARAEFGYADEHVVCGIAARLVPAKGHEFLFRAAAILYKEFPLLRILVLGEGDQGKALKQLAQECGIAGITHFAGFRDDMAYCIQALDIGVQPSIDCDTSSFSLKEQMASEKPVVASDYGGLSEIVTDGVEGFVVPAGTVEPLARALRVLIENPALRARLGRTGRQRVVRDFSVIAFVEKTIEAYHRAIGIHRERLARG